MQLRSLRVYNINQHYNIFYRRYRRFTLTLLQFVFLRPDSPDSYRGDSEINGNNFNKLKFIISSLFLFFALIFLISDCAQISSPAGGPKDTAPPKIKYSEPLNFSTGFSGKKILLKFDEFIQLSDVQRQVIISPPMKELPEFTLKGKELIIRFSEELKNNTTYSVFLGNAIKDITEGNLLDSNSFIFSTGSFLDSLTLHGSVANAFDGKPGENILVMLYENKDDSVPCKSLPDFFTRTNSSGIFTISHIKTGTYKIFALEDINNNYLYDLPDERLAFSGSAVNPEKPDEWHLKMFQAAKKKQFVKRTSAEKIGDGEKVMIALGIPAENPKIRILNYYSGKKPWELVEFSGNKDSIAWFGTMTLDTVKLEIADGNFFRDTVEIAVPALSKRSPPRLTMKTNLSPDGSFNFHNDFFLEFSHPVAIYDFKKIIFTGNKDTLPFKGGMADAAMRKMKAEPPAGGWKAATSYTLFIPPKTFTDVFGLANDSFSVKFNTKPAEFFGNLKLNIKPDTSCPSMVLQLINEKGLLLFSSPLPPPHQPFEEKQTVSRFNMEPGKYRLKAICDKNLNGKWDAGDYFSHRQPETVFFYGAEIIIRSNWDNEAEWVVK